MHQMPPLPTPAAHECASQVICPRPEVALRVPATRPGPAIHLVEVHNLSDRADLIMMVGPVGILAHVAV